MYQVEDLLRACELSMEPIRNNILSQYKESTERLAEIEVWYEDLIIKMKSEGLEKKGHLQFLKDLTGELTSLHQKLLKDPEETKYYELFAWAKKNIDEIKNKSVDKNLSDIEYMLNALYGVLILRLKKKTISEETLQAVSTFTGLIATLSKKYQKK